MSEAKSPRRGMTVYRLAGFATAAAIFVSNLVGTAIVFALSAWVLPTPEVADSSHAELVNLIAAAIYVGLALPIGLGWGLSKLSPTRRFLREERRPTAEELRATLRAPISIFVIQATLWLIAAVGFGILNLSYSGELAVRVATTVALGGLVTSAVGYLLTERLLRPVAARALAARSPEKNAVPGVAARAVLAWVLGSAIPTLGLLLIGLSALTESDFSRSSLAVAVLSLTGTVLGIGFLATVLAARATADPIISVRRGLARVEAGDLDVELPVYDGSEVGLLQSGFNRMVAGLRERERIRDLFGRQVGEDVARSALEGDVELGGEVREIVVLFVDVVGSTELAATRPAEEVVELLNSFFAVVVATVEDHGGWVNKFEGDAALAVFGAPVPLEDAPGRALAAARSLAADLHRELPELKAGVGVAGGPAVAGNVGTEHRYEYTVIGDPVNEAARLTELAKSVPGLTLATWATVEKSSEPEASAWEAGEEITLRGRSTATRLAVPRDRDG